MNKTTNPEFRTNISKSLSVLVTLLISLFIFASAMSTAAFAGIEEGEMTELKPVPGSNTKYEADIYLTLGVYEYNNARYLCLPKEANEAAYRSWSLPDDSVAELSNDKYYDSWECYAVCASAKGVGNTTATCTYTLDGIQYTCTFRIYVSLPDISNNLSFYLPKTEKYYDGNSLYPAEPERISSKDGGEDDVIFEYSTDGENWMPRNRISATNVIDSKTIKVRASIPNVYTGYIYDEQQLIINPRPVVLESASLTREYDGNPLTNGDEAITVKGWGWIYGEGADYSFNGTQTIAGSSLNRFTYDLNDRTDSRNYDITRIYGTLTVTDRSEKFEITVKALSDTFACDGTLKTVSGFETLNFIVNDNEFTVSGIEANGQGTDIGTYPVTINGTPVVKDAEGNDVSDQFIVHTVDGTLQIIRPSDGSAKGIAGKDVNPDTGDDMNLILWVVLLAAGMFTITGCGIRYRRNRAN